MYLLEEQRRFRGVASAHEDLNPLILQVLVNHLFGCSVVQHNDSTEAQVQAIVLPTPCTQIEPSWGWPVSLVSSTAALPLSLYLLKTLHEGGELTTTEL